MNRRVVVTGMGVVSSLGCDIDSFFNNIKNGKSGISPITSFDTSNHSVKIAGEVKINLDDYFTKKELNRMDRFTAFALIAAKEAISKSDLINKNDLNENVGVIIGSGIGGINTMEQQHLRLQKSPKRVSPFFVPSMILDIVSGHISIEYGFKGPNFAVVSACASSNHAIGESFNRIKYGLNDIIVTGGTEGGITPLSVAGFSNMKALSKNENYTIASRPFDNNRDGFVIAEGAGILVLEELEHALARNAKIVGEIVGYGASADAYHLTSPDENGYGAIKSMKESIKQAEIYPEDIDYINAHGTSTKYNDRIETSAIKSLFKEHAYKLHISSSKSMLGHLLGAAGALESIISILSIKNSIIPPTINYKTPDPECDLNYTPNESINQDIKYALSNTFGFGGHNSSLVFKHFN
ncbi:MAG: beta-ketoacyl-[acyl-carrier-protein] synthase II [Candidatus Marinimicrobia bacterium]|nr:beta-ketoacyl-[acyl-carrier-protein] synthase II [Candidatus Neomarinimicrobiota bacterium]